MVLCVVLISLSNFVESSIGKLTTPLKIWEMISSIVSFNYDPFIIIFSLYGHM